MLKFSTKGNNVLFWAFPSVSIGSRYVYRIHIPLHTNTKFSLIHNVLHSEIMIYIPKQILIKLVCSGHASEKQGQPLSPSERTRDQQGKLAGEGFVAGPGSLLPCGTPHCRAIWTVTFYVT